MNNYSYIDSFSERLHIHLHTDVIQFPEIVFKVLCITVM